MRTWSSTTSPRSACWRSAASASSVWREAKLSSRWCSCCARCSWQWASPHLYVAVGPVHGVHRGEEARRERTKNGVCRIERKLTIVVQHWHGHAIGRRGTASFAVVLEHQCKVRSLVRQVGTRDV